jgi:hypothetical protein
MLSTAAARRTAARRASEDLVDLPRFEDGMTRSMPIDEQYMVILEQYFK